MKTKEEKYRDLIVRRKECRLCDSNKEASMINLSNIIWFNKGKKFDYKHLSPWSEWQGNINSNLIIIGNDWASKEYLERHREDYEKSSCRDEPTNKKIRKYVQECVKKEMSEPTKNTNNQIFLTQCVLCLKDKNLKSKKDWEQDETAPRECFNNCSKLLKDTIELLFPKDYEKRGAIVTLSQRSTEIVLNLFKEELEDEISSLKSMGFDLKKSFGNNEEKMDNLKFTMDNKILNKLIDWKKEIILYNKIRLFPMQHPSRDAANRSKREKTNRPKGYWANVVKEDWKRVGNYLNYTDA
jgi:hypothetical protein